MPHHHVVEQVGNDAGAVWKYLDANGAASANRISKGTGLSMRETQRALGWLAREGKITIEQKKRGETIALG